MVRDVRVVSRCLSVAVLLLAAFAVSGCAGVRTDSRGPLMAEAVASTRPLVIRDAIGGMVWETAMLVRALNRAGRPVRIEDDCLSACGMLLAVDDLCYTADARFGFHAARVPGRSIVDMPSQALLERHYPEGVRAWFNASGAAETIDGFRYLSGAEMARLDDRARLCDTV